MEIPTVLTDWPLQAVLAIVAGLVILLVPRVLNYAIALYLLGAGTLGLLHFFAGGAVDPRAVLALVAGVLILVKPKVLSYVVGLYLLLLGLLEAGVLRL